MLNGIKTFSWRENPRKTNGFFCFENMAQVDSESCVHIGVLNEIVNTKDPPCGERTPGKLSSFVLKISYRGVQELYNDTFFPNGYVLKMVNIDQKSF
jgi:hypothetical protein